MTARHPVRKDCDGHRRTQKTGARTPKAAAGGAPFRADDHSYQPLPQDSRDTDNNSGGIGSVGSTRYSNAENQNEILHQEHQCKRLSKWTLNVGHVAKEDDFSPRNSTSGAQEIPTQLNDLIVNMEGEELGYAFQNAAELPPITKQSLSELDIPNIITNIKLRHDVNFDRNLSFRPNLDGAKGEEKRKVAANYWMALVAELELYARIFQGTPPLSAGANWEAIVQYVQRRIPKMFETIREVLKSLVPDRDHSRLDEHLDVSMLMQEIERGVCDLVRLAEWMAHLLKEHCAPMRDVWVDNMVEDTRIGAATNNSQKIVDGLRGLLGILEAMKLDVANHQIRNLMTLLIEDTINFERHYHLDKLVNGRTRVNIEAAHRWYESALVRFRQLCMPSQRDTMWFQLEVFVRAVVSTLFADDQHYNLPETFYLDHDRLRTLKGEIDDMIYFEICFDMCSELLRDFGYSGQIQPRWRSMLHTSLSAIVGHEVSHGPSQWTLNSEHISLELVRQAIIFSGCPPRYDFDLLRTAHHTNERLHTMFINRFHNHALKLESYILPQVLSRANRNILSPPMELFNKLIPIPSTPSTSQALTPTSLVKPNDTLSAPFLDHFSALSDRISHIILLHWRIWGPIAYVTEEDAASTSTSHISEEGKVSTSPLPTHARPPPPIENTTSETHIVAAMMTGEPPDSGQEPLEYAPSSLQ